MQLKCYLIPFYDLKNTYTHYPGTYPPPVFMGLYAILHHTAASRDLLCHRRHWFSHIIILFVRSAEHIAVASEGFRGGHYSWRFGL